MGKYIGNVPHLVDISATCTDVRFPGRQGQRKTKVIDARGGVELVMLPDTEYPSFFVSSSAPNGMRHNIWEKVIVSG